jgi:hypothetical protein
MRDELPGEGGLAALPRTDKRHDAGAPNGGPHSGNRLWPGNHALIVP